MESGGFVLFVLMTLGLIAGAICLIVLFAIGSTRRWQGLGLWLGAAAFLALFGRYLYQIYWLDERLLIAAAQGDAIQVKALLSAGANPDAAWEDGTPAVLAATRGGNREVVTPLKAAGAKEVTELR